MLVTPDQNESDDETVSGREFLIFTNSYSSDGADVTESTLSGDGTSSTPFTTAPIFTTEEGPGNSVSSKFSLQSLTCAWKGVFIKGCDLNVILRLNRCPDGMR